MKTPNDKGTIASQVFEVLSEYSNQNINETSYDLKIVDDLGLDSFSMVEIIYELEIRLGIKVTNEDLKKIATVGDVVTIAEKG